MLSNRQIWIDVICINLKIAISIYRIIEDAKDGVATLIISMDSTNIAGAKRRKTGEETGYDFVSYNVAKDKKNDHPVTCLFIMTVKNYIIYWEHSNGGTGEHTQACSAIENSLDHIKNTVDELSKIHNIRFDVVFTTDAGIICDNVKILIESRGFHLVAKMKIIQLDSIIAEIKNNPELGFGIDKYHNYYVEINRLRTPNLKVCELKNVPRELRKKHYVTEGAHVTFSPYQYDKDTYKLNEMIAEYEQIKNNQKAVRIKISSKVAGIANLDDYKIEKNEDKVKTHRFRSGFTGHYITYEYSVNHAFAHKKLYWFQSIQENSFRVLKEFGYIKRLWSKTIKGIAGQIAIGIMAQNVVIINYVLNINYTIDEFIKELLDGVAVNDALNIFKDLQLNPKISPELKHWVSNLININDRLKNINSIYNGEFIEDDLKVKEEKNNPSVETKGLKIQKLDYQRNAKIDNFQHVYLNASEINELLRCFNLIDKIPQCLTIPEIISVVKNTTLNESTQHSYIMHCKNEDKELTSKAKFLFDWYRILSEKENLKSLFKINLKKSED